MMWRVVYLHSMSSYRRTPQWSCKVRRSRACCVSTGRKQKVINAYLVASRLMPALISVKLVPLRDPQAGSTAKVNGDVTLTRFGQSPAHTEEHDKATTENRITFFEADDIAPDYAGSSSFKGQQTVSLKRAQPKHVDRQLKRFNVQICPSYPKIHSLTSVSLCES